MFRWIHGAWQRQRGDQPAEPPAPSLSPDSAGDGAEPVNPIDLIGQALRRTHDVLDQYEVTVALELADPGEVHLDAGRLLTALIHLIDNAADAMKETMRQRVIMLKCTNSPIDAGLQLRFEVSDSGAGIAPQNLSRLFANGFTTSPDGEGVALRAAADAVSEMGGTLTVSSAGADSGATFTLEVPAIVARPRQ
ncbi:MAG: putative signal transduction histidine kinase [Phycisphaerales bacterium]|nr:putative signal transduction histidine kinase [Phycisphaerales bacterium]